MLERGRKSDPILALFFVSGFAGLIYEAIWTHYLKLFLGHAAYAQTVVLVVFIGGLALGAWLCARVAERVRNPLRAYALAEGAIGLVSLVFHPIFVAAVDWGYTTLLPAACEPASAFCVPQWLLAALLLAPQSILLGTTFPLVSSAVLRTDASQPGHDVAALYFLNSLGAVLGVLAAAFVMVPGLGLPGTLKVVGCVNLLLALAAFLLSRTAPPPLAIAPIAPAVESTAPDAEGRLTRLLLATAFLTGLSSFIYEIAWIRMLSLVLGASTHSFELMLASFILGLALGGAWVRKRVDRVADTVRLLAIVQLAMGAAAAATIPVYDASFDLMAWILYSLARNDAGFLLFNLSSSAIALAVMLPATFCAGMTLPLITYRLLRSRSGEKAIGLVYAVNTLGAIIGVVIAVHLLLEWLGLRGTLLAGAAIDVALGVVLIASLRAPGQRFRVPAAAVVCIAIVVAIAVGFHIDPRRSASGVFRSGVATLGRDSNIVFHRDGKTATVDVLEQHGVRSIRTNGKSDAAIQMSAEKPAIMDEYTMAMLALLPLGHQPAAKKAAVIGFGSGMSTAFLLGSPTLERVDTIEIEPAMVEGAKHFRPHVAAAFDDPRSRIVIDDAKAYFARGGERYDIIISEPSNPWVSGVASLFTEEFYRRLADYLNDGGVLSQWLHAYDIDNATVASIMKALGRTFPDYVVYSSNEGDLIVVARKGGATGSFRPEAIQHPGLQSMLRKVGFADPRVVGAQRVASSEALGPLFASYPIRANSDYYPVVDQHASRTRFTRARANDLLDLQGSGVPILEMVGGAPPPPAEPLRAIAATPVEARTIESWRLRDSLVRAGPRKSPEPLSSHETFAEVARSWAGCQSHLSFNEVLPAMVAVSDRMTARLPAQVAASAWASLGASPCARALPPGERAWLELLEAIARRDADAMVATGTRVLDGARGTGSAGAQMALLAVVTAHLCRGEQAKARALLQESAKEWMPAGVHESELRLLDAMAHAPEGSRPGACARR